MIFYIIVYNIMFLIAHCKFIYTNFFKFWHLYAYLTDCLYKLRTQLSSQNIIKYILNIYIYIGIAANILHYNIYKSEQYFAMFL